jgi:hypothetical protein
MDLASEAELVTLLWLVIPSLAGVLVAIVVLIRSGRTV